MNRRQFNQTVLKALPFLGLSTLVNSCSSQEGLGLGGGLLPQYLISTGMIRSKMRPHFPYSQSIHNMVRITLRNPQFSMAPEINKVRVGMTTTAQVADRLSSPLPLLPHLHSLAGHTSHGTCQVACGLRYDQKSRSIFLKDPVLEHIEFSDIPMSYTQSAKNLVNTLGPAILNRYPIHTLDPRFGTRFIKRMDIQDQGIALKFGL